MSQSYKGMTIPAYTDAADGPLAFQDFTSSGPIPRFADASARDAALTAPTNGQMCFLTTPGLLQVRSAGAWVTMYIEGDLNLNGNQVSNVGDPAVDTDGASWGYLKTNTLKTVSIGKEGTLATGAGTFRWYAPEDLTIVRVTASVGTAPTGQALIVDVNRSGVSIFTTQSNRPTIADGTFFDASGVPDLTSMTKDVNYLTVDIDQVGSTVAGADLTVTIEYVKA